MHRQILKVNLSHNRSSHGVSANTASKLNFEPVERHVHSIDLYTGSDQALRLVTEHSMLVSLVTGANMCPQEYTAVGLLTDTR